MNLKRTGSQWNRNQRININDNWDVIEKWLNQLGKSMQDLVAEGQLTEEQYTQLLTTLYGLADIHKVDQMLSGKRDKSEKLEPEDLSENVLHLVTGEGSINLESIPQDNSVSPSKLTDDYNHKGRLTSEDDLNGIYQSGTYYAIDCANRPTNDNYNIIVDYFDNRYVTQIAIGRQDATQVYIRSRDLNNTHFFNEWKRVVTGEITSDNLSDDFEYAGTTNIDLNTLIKSGNYVATIGLPNRPPDSDNSSALIRVYSFGTTYIQEYMQYSDTSKMWRRRIRPDNDDFREWYPIQTGNNLQPVDPNSPFAGKKIAMFGDSILANYNIPSMVGNLTGADVYNFSVGGTRMGYHSMDEYDAFSMYRLADAITSEDFTLQDAGVAGGVNVTDYEGMKNMDYNTVDYIIISFGTNDFGGGNRIDDYPDPEQWYRNISDATRYVIEKIATTYPHIKLLFTTPIFRNRTTDNGLNSDENPNANGNYLIEYVDAIIKEVNEEHIPVLDLHRKSNINKYNQAYYLVDELHPTAIGAEHLAKMISSGLASIY